MSEHTLRERWPLGKKEKWKRKEKSKAITTKQNTVIAMTVYSEKNTSLKKKSTQWFSYGIILPNCWSDQSIPFKMTKKISCSLQNRKQFPCVVLKLCWTYVDINTIPNIWHRTEVPSISMIFNLFWMTGYIMLHVKILIQIQTSC